MRHRERRSDVALVPSLSRFRLLDCFVGVASSQRRFYEIYGLGRSWIGSHSPLYFSIIDFASAFEWAGMRPPICETTSEAQ